MLKTSRTSRGLEIFLDPEKFVNIGTVVQVCLANSVTNFVQAGLPLLTVETCRKLFSIPAPDSGLVSSINFHEDADSLVFDKPILTLRTLTQEQYKQELAARKKAKEEKKPAEMNRLELLAMEAQRNRAAEFFVANFAENLPRRNRDPRAVVADDVVRARLEPNIVLNVDNEANQW